MKYYGSLDNRLEENKMYTDKIEVGTGMTEYSWSDRTPYEVVKVVNQKHVFVRRYDYKKADDIPMSNNWDLISNENNPLHELKLRYGYWNEVIKGLDGKVRYSRKNVSFGTAEYYYDYEF